MAIITSLLIALLLVAPCAWADGFKTFKTFDTFSDSSSYTTTTVIIERSPLDSGAEPYMGFPYMDPPNLRTSYNYRVSVLYPYRFCCQGYYLGYGYFDGYWWK
jgi:hypothetical protein